MYRQTRWALNFSLFSVKVNGEFVLRACSCCCVCRTVAGAVLAVCCRCLVVGMVAAVAIVVSVAVDEAGGESVRNMFVQRGAGGDAVLVAVVRVVVVHVAPGWRLPLLMLFLLLLSLSLSFLLDHRGLCVTRLRFAVVDPKVGTADPESPAAATDFPCCFHAM